MKANQGGPFSQTVLRPAEVLAFHLNSADSIPNNRLPLLVYRRAIDLSAGDPAEIIEQLFASNHWTGCWRNGIYDYHHYHSTSHEVLGVFAGSAQVQFGGPQGTIQEVRAGDVVIIPAGVAHKNLGASRDFGVVGAYPANQEWDMCYGKTGERPDADNRIARVPLPERDPIYGSDGPLLKHWTG